MTASGYFCISVARRVIPPETFHGRFFFFQPLFKINRFRGQSGAIRANSCIVLIQRYNISARVDLPVRSRRNTFHYYYYYYDYYYYHNITSVARAREFAFVFAPRHHPRASPTPKSLLLPVRKTYFPESALLQTVPWRPYYTAAAATTTV